MAEAADFRMAHVQPKARPYELDFFDTKRHRGSSFYFAREKTHLGVVDHVSIRTSVIYDPSGLTIQHGTVIKVSKLQSVRDEGHDPCSGYPESVLKANKWRDEWAFANWMVPASSCACRMFFRIERVDRHNGCDARVIGAGL